MGGKSWEKPLVYCPSSKQINTKYPINIIASPSNIKKMPNCKDCGTLMKKSKTHSHYCPICVRTKKDYTHLI